MQLIVFSTYDELSKQASDDLVELMQTKKDPLLCVASGHSPAGLYKDMVNKISKKELDISHWSFVELDEWVGLNGNDEGSCQFHLNNQFFHPLKVDKNKTFFFDGRKEDLEKECRDAEIFISRHRGIHVAILGLGLNGHIGMNEPGTSATSRSHITELEPITQNTGQKYFQERQQLKKGITLGLATIMESENLILLASGLKKAEIVKKVLEGEIGEDVPASLLRKHPRVRIYLDAEAARLLDPSTRSKVD